MSAMSEPVLRPYFRRDDFLRGDPAQGTLTNFAGHRMIVLPEDLIQGLHRAIAYETGHAWPLVAYACGRRWGERLVRTWQREWREAYACELDASMYLYVEIWLKEAFAHYGWGELELDFSLEDQGVVQLWLRDSVLARLLVEIEGDHVCDIFTGVFAATLSWLAGRDLEAVEVACSKSGHERCRFAVALPEHVEAAQRAKLDGGDPDSIMRALLA